MRMALLIIGAIIVLLVVVAAAIWFSGSAPKVVGWLWGPGHGWDLKLKVPAPDYAQESSWAALPSNPGLTALRPKGVAAPDGAPPVDVFFIHPTGFMNGSEWNSPLNPNSQTEENTQWMMANQASVYNGCCAIYAPRYRQASIFRYISASKAIYKQAGDFAYDDVDRAFMYFLEHYSHGRPFIIAGHSQGTEHGFTLVQRRIDGTPLAQRMVAAYLIGGGITDKDVDALKTVHACTSATDLHCVIHWATHGEGATPDNGDVDGKRLCINPLTWQRDGGLAAATLSKGAVPMSGRFQIKVWGDDSPSGMQFPPLEAPRKGWTTAECRDGFLFAKDQGGTEFARGGAGKNYHGLDYALFAMDIRENAQARVAAYLAQLSGAPQ